MTRFLPDSRRSSAVSVNPGGAGTPPRIPDRTGDPGSSSDVCGDDSPVLCGLKPVLELLEKHPERIDALWLRKGRRSPETQRILDLCRAAGIRFSLTDAASLERMLGEPAQHQGVAARLFPKGFADFSHLLAAGANAPLPLIVALDQVQDPGNAGTLARTLHALGGAGLAIPRHKGLYLGGAARRAAAGELEELPVAKVMNLGRAMTEARRAGWRVYGAAAETADGEAGANALAASLHLPALLVLGGEEKGLRPHVREKCDEILRIPMLRPFDSLNVAQAGAILIACLARSLPAFMRA